MSVTGSQAFLANSVDGTPRLTRAGVESLTARLVDITERRLPELRPLLVEPERDMRNVAEFERLIEESLMLEQLLAAYEPIELDVAHLDGRVVLGMRAQIRFPDGSSAWVRPVHPAESALDDERISATSPLAIALLGARAGHTIWVSAPQGLWACEVLDVAVD